MNRIRNTVFVCLSVIVISLVFITACNKENSNSSAVIPSGQQKVSVTLNDGPVPNLSSVIVDIRYVEVKVDTGKLRHDDDYYDDDHEGDNDEQDDHGDHENHHGDRFGVWDTVGVTPGLYDLVKLQNGMDTLIANGITQAGKITMIRVTLGNNNSVSTDATHQFPLPICDHSPYVYANIRSVSLDSIGNNQFFVHLDFNIARSIHFDDGQYCLKPVIKPYSNHNTGTIEGIVLPAAAHAYVEVLNNTDTALAIPEDNGEFKIKGLAPGVYSVLFKSVALYQDTTLTNITVLLGEETKLPTIELHP
jgi:Domain of unknown function (DUF4382)